MKQLLVMLTVLLGLTVTHAQQAQQVQADPGRTLISPSETLQENDCVFKNKGVASLQDYQYIVDKCDRRYSPSLMIIADHLPQGACVYNLVQKMTGYTIARVVNQCPALDNQEIQGIVPDAPLEDHMPPMPGDEVTPAKKQGAKPKAKAKPQEEAAPASPAKNKDEVKPKTADQIEKGNDGYYINPDEIEF